MCIIIKHCYDLQDLQNNDQGGLPALGNDRESQDKSRQAHHQLLLAVEHAQGEHRRLELRVDFRVRLGGEVSAQGAEARKTDPLRRRVHAVSRRRRGFAAQKIAQGAAWRHGGGPDGAME